VRSLRSPKTLEDAIVLFSDDALCQAVVVECRWSDGIVRCPYCGSYNVTYLERARRFKCYGAHPKAQFSLKVGTVFEDSAVGWEHWLPALWMLVNGTVRMSSHRLADAFGVTQKTAWFMLARLRTALNDTAAPGPGDPMTRFKGGLRRALAVPKTSPRVSRTPRPRPRGRSSKRS
jgi:transposase-like protein